MTFFGSITKRSILALSLGLVAALVPASALAADQAPATATPPVPAANAPQPSAAPPAAAPQAAKPTGPATAEQMQGLNFEGMTDAQKQLAVSILNEHSCDCSCGMKLGVCRRDDSKCGRSLALATQVLDLVKQGKTREEVVKTALAPPPSKYVSFAIPVGDAPTIGPKTAKVTILHYLDYQ